jgi:hypothetical protein
MLTLAVAAAISLPPLAEDARTYQGTGPVLEVSAIYIVLQKGDQKWQIAVDPSTQGDNVTAYYKMTAAEIVTKPAKNQRSPGLRAPARESGLAFYLSYWHLAVSIWRMNIL